MSAFSSRLNFGVQKELLELMQIPGLKGSHARVLYNAGLKTIQLVAESIPNQLESLLKNAEPYKGSTKSVGSELGVSVPYVRSFNYSRLSKQIISSSKRLLAESSSGLQAPFATSTQASSYSSSSSGETERENEEEFKIIVITSLIQYQAEVVPHLEDNSGNVEFSFALNCSELYSGTEPIQFDSDNKVNCRLAPEYIIHGLALHFKGSPVVYYLAFGNSQTVDFLNTLRSLMQRPNTLKIAYNIKRYIRIFAGQAVQVDTFIADPLIGHWVLDPQDGEAITSIETLRDKYNVRLKSKIGIKGNALPTDMAALECFLSFQLYLKTKDHLVRCSLFSIFQEIEMPTTVSIAEMEYWVLLICMVGT